MSGRTIRGNYAGWIGSFILAVLFMLAANGAWATKAWGKLPLWLQKSWGPWTTYGGGGYAINPARRRTITFSVDGSCNAILVRN